MASGGKKKTTMAKLTRESRLRERRVDKQARKDARKLAPAPDAETLRPNLNEAHPQPADAHAQPEDELTEALAEV